jgi:FkbH-like protein
MNTSNLRHEIEELLRAEQWMKAAVCLTTLWEREASPALAAFVAAAYEGDQRQPNKLRGRVELKPHRCAILRSFTIEPIVPIWKACALTSGIDLTIHLGEFNAYVQELLDGDSPLYAFYPETVILAVQTRDIAPELWKTSVGADVVERVSNQFAGLVRAFRARTHANLMIHSLEMPPAAAQGVYESQVEENQAWAVERINRNLRKLALDFRGVYVLDYDKLVARHGRENWGDARKWLTVRLPIAAANLIWMAREWMRFLVPLAGRVAKVVAVDLDNTLWGGVIGEDGMTGIQVGPEYPGAAYQALQQALLDLTGRGILLAIASKNNPADAMEALRTHPGMLLRPEHFAAMRIDWNEKSQNLREIAAELNLGLDAIAFLDDNPVERQRVREEIPEVIVVELSGDPMTYARAVRDCPAFERLAISEEDRQRTRYYAADKQRTALEQSTGSREDFYRSLKQEAEIAPVNALTLARVAQLTQKTNQFNLTTKRYTEPQVEELARRPDWQVLAIKVRDRYADNGLVGAAITHDRGDVCEVDTFLLSCRVIGRTVETALLAYLAEAARERGLRRLDGWFLPTKKNAPARDFYREHGFRLLAEETPEGAPGQLWSLELAEKKLRCPHWVRLIVFDRAMAEKA